MNDTLIKLTEMLSQDERLVIDGKLAKNKIIELALQLDTELLRRLKSSENLKKVFFQEVDDILVFDKIKFQSFVSNKSFLPDSFTEYKNKIGLISDRQYLSDNEEVVLAFPYKDCILEGGQTKEDAKRNEIFWNETLAPDEIDRLLESKVLTNFKKYDKDGEHTIKDIASEDNLIIKGNNLLALYSLKKKYKGKIKLIYIDPPYNTGDDSFRYNDSFNHSSWLVFMKNRFEIAKQLLSNDGAIFVQIDLHEVGYLNLLLDEVFGNENFVQLISVKTASPAGFKTVNPGPIDVTEYIFFYTKKRSEFKFKKGYVPVEYDENYNLVITNPTEKPENWKLESLVNTIYTLNGIEIGKTYQQSAKNAEAKWGPYWKIIRKQIMAEYALKNAETVVSIRDPHKPAQTLRELLEKSKSNRDRVFTYSKSTDENGDENSGYVINGGALAFYRNKVREIDGIKTPTELLTDLWLDISWDGIAGEGSVKLKNGKKPEKLLQRIIELTTKSGDIVLDYHLGSGTTCAVAHKMGRQYFGIEQLDYDENDSIIRLKNVINGDQTGVSKAVNWHGGGSFLYAELAQANQYFVEKIRQAKNTNELLKVWGQMKEMAFLSYKINPKDIDATKKDFEDLSFENQQKFLVSILDKNLLYVLYSDIDDKTFQIPKEVKELNHSFYGDK